MQVICVTDINYILYTRYGDIATMAKSNFFEKISC